VNDDDDEQGPTLTREQARDLIMSFSRRVTAAMEAEVLVLEVPRHEALLVSGLASHMQELLEVTDNGCTAFVMGGVVYERVAIPPMEEMS
jgi:hypothetical protein